MSPDGDATSTARGAGEHFGLQEMETCTPALRRALRKAALEGLPAYLHILACVPVFDDDPNLSLPPRWQVPDIAATSVGSLPIPRMYPLTRHWCVAQYAAVRKAFFLFYEPVGVAPGSTKQGSSTAREQLGGHSLGTPHRLQSLFQAVRAAQL